MAEPEHPHKTFLDLESRIQGIDKEASNFSIMLQKEYIAFMEKNFFNKETGQFKYDPLSDEHAKQLAEDLMTTLRTHFSLGTMTKDGKWNAKQMDQLDDLIELYTGHSKHELAKSLSGSKLTYNEFGRVVSSPAVETFQRQRSRKYQSQLASLYGTEETRKTYKDFLNSRLNKAGYEIHPEKEMLPEDAIGTFFDVIRGLPNNYHEGKNYIRQKKAE